MVLSAIWIDTQYYHLSIQHSWKMVRFTKLNHTRRHHHRQRFNMSNRLLHILLSPLVFFKYKHAVHTLPGTNHAIIQSERSTNTACQYKYIDTIINQLRSNNPVPTAFGSTYTPREVGSLSTYVHLRQEPVCFIADTDSVSYTIDIAANHIIVTNAGMLTDLKICSSKIKGVGGKGVQITRTGKQFLPLMSESDDTDIIFGLDTVLVSTSQTSFPRKI